MFLGVISIPVVCDVEMIGDCELIEVSEVVSTESDGDLDGTVPRGMLILGQYVGKGRVAVKGKPNGFLTKRWSG